MSNNKVKLDDIYKINSYISYPTVFVLCLGYLFWLGALVLGLYYNYNWYCTLPLSTIGCYICFTPLHDATHGSICKNKHINEIAGTISGIPFFFAPFKTFKLIHLRHHAYTNDPENDPDYYSGAGSPTLLPLRWFTMVGHYYYYFFRILFDTLSKKVDKFNSIRDGSLCHDAKQIYNVTKDNKFIKYLALVLESLAIILFNWGVLIYSFFKGNFYNTFILWVLPSFFTITILAYLFDYIPHRPHDGEKHMDIHKNTNMTDGFFGLNNGKSNILLDIITFNQTSYHNIHHLYPWIPFYKYGEIWRKYKKKLIKRGTPIQSLFGKEKINK